MGAGKSITEAGTLVGPPFVQKLPGYRPSQEGASRAVKNQLPVLRSLAGPCTAPWACHLIIARPHIPSCLLQEALLDAVPIFWAPIAPSLPILHVTLSSYFSSQRSVLFLTCLPVCPAGSDSSQGLEQAPGSAWLRA